MARYSYRGSSSRRFSYRYRGSSGGGGSSGSKGRVKSYSKPTSTKRTDSYATGWPYAYTPPARDLTRAGYSARTPASNAHAPIDWRRYPNARANTTPAEQQWRYATHDAKGVAYADYGKDARARYRRGLYRSPRELRYMNARYGGIPPSVKQSRSQAFRRWRGPERMRAPSQPTGYASYEAPTDYGGGGGYGDWYEPPVYDGGGGTPYYSQPDVPRWWLGLTNWTIGQR